MALDKETPTELPNPQLALEELEVGVYYTCGLTGSPVLISDKDETTGLVTAMHYNRVSGLYAYFHVAERQLRALDL